MPVMIHMYSACTYSVSGFRLESQKRMMELCCGWGAYDVCITLYVSNCKWHSTLQIQLVIAAHDKYTLWRVQEYGS